MPNILIVEDEPRIASFIEKGLRSQGFTTTILTDGLYVLDVIQSATFDLLILDLGLPGKDGFQVLEELRGQGESKYYLRQPVTIDRDRHIISNLH